LSKNNQISQETRDTKLEWGKQENHGKLQSGEIAPKKGDCQENNDYEKHSPIQKFRKGAPKRSELIPIGHCKKGEVDCWPIALYQMSDVRVRH